MAKRFTDTAIWDKAWFRKLPPRLKETWRYLCDKCNHAGIWEIDIEALVFNVGESVTMEEIQTSFGDRINRFCENKIFISSFISFQYKCSVERLNPKSKIHKSVIEILEKHSLYKPFGNPLERVKDKDKEMDKDKDKENENQFQDEPIKNIQKEIDLIISLSNDLFTRDGYQIDPVDFNARNMIGGRIFDSGFDKVQIAVDQAKKDYFDDPKMFKMCHWKMLFRQTSIDKLYTDAELSPPKDQKKSGKVIQMPAEIK